MPEREPEQRGAGGSFDQIAEDLRQLRLDAGEVSYAEIVLRIAKHREAGGVAPAAARPALTTIYDAFRTGRSRINTELVGEIARALGASEEEAAQWERRCIDARRDSDRARTAEPPAPNTDAQPAPVPTAPRAAWWERHAVLARVLLAVACLGVNYAGYNAALFFGLSLYMDTIGTGIAAMVLGPWWGVAVGASMNLLGYAVQGPVAIPFALQSAIFGLIWGFGARRFRMTQTIGKYFRLNIYVGLSHMLIAIPLVLAMFHGSTGHPRDGILHRLAELGIPMGVSVFFGQLMLALADVLLAGFIILMVIGILKNKPPFNGACAQLLPFLDTQAGSRVFARVGLMVLCLGINFAGYCAVEFFELSLYLDAIGTGLAAIVLGPWWGVAVGVSTNLLGYTVHGTMALPFAFQSAALAVVWGYGARRFQMTQTLGKYFRLNVFAGFSHSVVAVPILLALFGGGTGHAGMWYFRSSKHSVCRWLRRCS